METVISSYFNTFVWYFSFRILSNKYDKNSCLIFFSFSFNLAYGSAIGDPRSDTALHFNPRFTQNCVVRNSYKNNNWAGEERQNGMPFTKHTPFEITISADVNCYKVSFILFDAQF